LNDNMKRLKDGALHFLETEILELSLVPVPMQALATINQIKSFDAETRAALGITPAIDTQQRAASGKSQRRVVRLTPGDSGTAEKRKSIKLIPR
jgi:hypothetical protein